MKRQILYITGTRADFGLMLPTLQAIHAHEKLALSICVTGMHLSQRYGLTVNDVYASGLPIAAEIKVGIDDDSGVGMASAAAQTMVGLTDLLRKARPSILLVLGDRAEMLVAALAATLAGIPVAHLCGGERSGTVDEAIRHSISKLAHVHLVATEGSRARLLAMGEDEAHVHVVGAPGLVEIHTAVTKSKDELFAALGLDPLEPTAIVLFHPVVQDSTLAGEQAQLLLRAVNDEELQGICLMPNADAGNGQIREMIYKFCEGNPGFKAVVHLARTDFLSLLASCELLIGNSSSGIVEAASFSIPVVNIGDRQKDRERNSNVVDTPIDANSIRDGIKRARSLSRSSFENIYGDGRTNERVASLLANLNIDVTLMKKSNSY